MPGQVTRAGCLLQTVCRNADHAPPAHMPLLPRRPPGDLLIPREMLSQYSVGVFQSVSETPLQMGHTGCLSEPKRRSLEAWFIYSQELYSQHRFGDHLPYSKWKLRPCEVQVGYDPATHSLAESTGATSSLHLHWGLPGQATLISGLRPVHFGFAGPTAGSRSD